MLSLDPPNPDKPVVAKRKSRFIGELNIDPPVAERFVDVALRGVGATTPTSQRLRSALLCSFIIDPAEDGKPVIQGHFWNPARRSAVAGMTSDAIYAGVIFESPQPQFSGLTLILKKQC